MFQLGNGIDIHDADREVDVHNVLHAHMDCQDIYYVLFHIEVPYILVDIHI